MHVRALSLLKRDCHLKKWELFWMTIIWNYFKSICTCVPPISFIHPKWTKAWQAIVPALMYVSMLATSWPFGARHAIDVNLECWHCVQITLCRYQAGLTPPTLGCWEGFCFVCAKVEGVFGFCLVGSMGGKGGIMQKDHSCWFVWVVIYINLYMMEHNFKKVTTRP